MPPNTRSSFHPERNGPSELIRGGTLAPDKKAYSLCQTIRYSGPQEAQLQLEQVRRSLPLTCASACRLLALCRRGAPTQTTLRRPQAQNPDLVPTEIGLGGFSPGSGARSGQSPVRSMLHRLRPTPEVPPSEWNSSCPRPSFPEMPAAPKAFRRESRQKRRCRSERQSLDLVLVPETCKQRYPARYPEPFAQLESVLF